MHTSSDSKEEPESKGDTKESESNMESTTPTKSTSKLIVSDIIRQFEEKSTSKASKQEPRGHTATDNHQHGMALYHIGMRNLVNVPLMIYNVMVKIPSAARNASLRKLTGVNLVRFERLEELSIAALCNIPKLTLQKRKMKRMKMKLLRGE
ncbi:hypothetical protein MRB53_010860 [Persea americana]|uniref:Uncharacterized protein n=1 Tax=Persea americana TaxID=3435 RepID=A0ACC2LTC0_PERAE|nr:hypothetical protein MRB53_010860 [Persea americana]